MIVVLVIIIVIITQREKVVEIIKGIPPQLADISKQISRSFIFKKSVKTESEKYYSEPSLEGVETEADYPLDQDLDITFSPARVNNYAAIKIVAGMFKVLAWLFLIVGVFIAIFVLSDMGLNWEGFGAVLLVLFFFGSSSFYFIFFAQTIYVILDIEANSRQTAKTLERFLRISSAIDAEM